MSRSVQATTNSTSVKPLFFMAEIKMNSGSKTHLP
jgi:hypothetical protein